MASEQPTFPDFESAQQAHLRAKEELKAVTEAVQFHRKLVSGVSGQILLEDAAGRKEYAYYRTKSGKVIRGKKPEDTHCVDHVQALHESILRRDHPPREKKEENEADVIEAIRKSLEEMGGSLT